MPALTAQPEATAKAEETARKQEQLVDELFALIDTL